MPFKKKHFKEIHSIKRKEVQKYLFDREQTHIFIGKQTKKLESKETYFLNLFTLTSTDNHLLSSQN